MDCLYFIYARLIYVRAHVKITRQWKSTLSVNFIYMTIKSCFLIYISGFELKLSFKQSLGTTREWPIAGFQPCEKAAILVDKTTIFFS